MRDVFEKIFLDSQMMKNYDGLELPVYQCIESIFSWINQKFENIEINNKKIIYVTRFSDIIGAQFFWNVVLYAGRG